MEIKLGPLGLLLLAYVLGLVLTSLVRGLLLSRALVDHPNERSSHKAPVPRGGGLALVLILLPAMLCIAALEGKGTRYAGVILGTFLLAGISWLDDRKGAGVGLRLGLHLLAAYFGSLAFTSDELIFGGHLPFWLDRTIMVIGWAWFINLYNFMDGIDGLTGVETISIACGLVLLEPALPTPDPMASLLAPVLIGATLGFLTLNWHPAKIFLGDIGSVPLGYVTGFLLLTLAVKGEAAAALILPLYSLADSGLTLVKRGLRGEKVWQAHREHFYQRAAQGMGRHDKVVTPILFANIILIVCALGSLWHPLTAFSVAFVLIALLLLWMHNSAPRNS